MSTKGKQGAKFGKKRAKRRRATIMKKIKGGSREGGDLRKETKQQRLSREKK